MIGLWISLRLTNSHGHSPISFCSCRIRVGLEVENVTEILLQRQNFGHNGTVPLSSGLLLAFSGLLDALLQPIGISCLLKADSFEAVIINFTLPFFLVPISLPQPFFHSFREGVPEVIRFWYEICIIGLILLFTHWQWVKIFTFSAHLLATYLNWISVWNILYIDDPCQLWTYSMCDFQ